MKDDRKLVSFGRPHRRPDPARVAEFAATARKLQQERDETADLVERLLRETPARDWPRLAERPELRNSGALEHLSKENIVRLTVDPRESLVIAEVATAIADAVAAEEYPPVVVAQMRAQAWKDRGQALAYLARYDEAFDAFDRAEQALAAFGTVAHDLAIVHLVRATALQEVHRPTEALALLAQSRTVFADYGDQRRHLICGIAEGALLHRVGRLREAREAFLMLLDPARAANDRATLGSIHNNVGHTSTELGDFDEAETHLQRAIAIFTELGQPLPIAKAQLARGRLLVRRGQVDRGIAHLRALREQFLGRGMVEEAGLSALDIVEALLTTGAVAEAERLARTIVDELRDAGLSARAITALGTLSEAIAARKVSAATIADVRRSLCSLHAPPRDYVASA